MAVRHLAKVMAPVRFRYPAQKRPFSAILGGILGTVCKNYIKVSISKAFSNQFNSSSLSVLDGEDSIVLSAIQGESSAFGLLYDYYQPKIYRFVILKVGHREEAEDITHQVFLSAWQNINKYKVKGFPFSSWLYRIARNQVIDHYRTRKVTSAIDEVQPEYIISPAVAHMNVEKDIEIDKVMKAVQGLDRNYQDVVIMRFVEDLSLRETAAALGKTEGAVKLMQHRAIKKLKTLLS